jgi:hypothetical protein
MSIDEINKDMKDKKTVLCWMLENGLRSIDQVGDVMSQYYKDPESVLKMAKVGKKPEGT